MCKIMWKEEITFYPKCIATWENQKVLVCALLVPKVLLAFQLCKQLTQMCEKRLEGEVYF